MRRADRSFLLALVLSLGLGTSLAGGPRYVSGPPYFTNNPGTPIGWKQPRLLYFTDPGPLSASVSHQQADALVAAAAAVWNLPVASITVARGGPLAEEVSGANVYLGSSGVVFPADVQSSNAAAIPIAILYDADGSVTDTLLGSGASNPLGCRQNAVTESVDAFDPVGSIEHAIVILNGRCTGPAPEQQLQMQYQLERVFGRVLGLAWSQANDNVFTGTPTPTYAQALHWPIMHPLDIYCGAYTYQCLPQPFTLRPDDIAAMVMLYPNADGVALPAGKQPSLASALRWLQPLEFPMGEGMGGVNLVARLIPGSNDALQPWVEVSAPTGFAFRRNAASPFVAAETGVRASFGSTDASLLSRAIFAWIPIVDGLSYTGFAFNSEPVNPLYIGAYSIGPYASGSVAPAGSTWQENDEGYADQPRWQPPAIIADAPAACGSGEDGSAGSPIPVDPSGFWAGVLCGYGHASYLALPVKPKRTLTVEVTALDAQGAATTAKMRPVVALFAPSDAADALPSVAVAPEAFASANLGMTTLTAATGNLSSLRLGIADQRNDGRPDFLYQARLFYADSIAPALVPASGAPAVVTGSGFRPGNAVLINGRTAQVTGWTANTITLQLPTMTQAAAASGVAVDVTVKDLRTGATSVLTAALTYSVQPVLPPSLRILSAPSGVIFTGAAAAGTFRVQETAADGSTPVAGQPLVFAMPVGAGSFGACGQPTCSVATDSDGIASTAVTPAVPGTLILTATDPANPAVSVSTSVTVRQSAGSMLVLTAPTETLYATQPATTPFSVQVLSGGPNPQPLAGRSVRFTVPTGAALFSACHCSDLALLTDANGTASAAFTPVSVGALTLKAADGALLQQVSLTAASFADTLRILAAPTSGAIAGTSSGSFTVALVHGDGVTPDAGETVRITTSPGVSFTACSSNVCSLVTGQNGEISTGVVARQGGNFTVQATFGSLSQSASFTVRSNDPILKILSAPTGNVPVGQPASVPIVAVLTDGSGNPMQGEPIFLATAANVAYFPADDYGSAVFFTDSNGQVSATIEPYAAGEVPTTVSYGFQQVNTSFIAVGGNSLSIVQQPGSAGAPVGVQQVILLKLLGPDGKTPVAGEWVHFAVAEGLLALLYCDNNSCNRQSDGDGILSITGTPEVVGPTTLLATDGSLSQPVSFLAVQPADVLTVLSGPPSGSLSGSAAATPLRIRVTLPDGVTPAANHTVTLSVTSGSAGLAGCSGAATCSLTADLEGVVTSAVTPQAAGLVTLTATEGGGSVSASFTAAPAPTLKPDTLTLVTAPSGSSPVGQANATPLTVRVLQSDGVTPSAGQSIAFAVTAGSASLSACASAPCSVLTDAKGEASTSVTPTSAGSIGVTATESSDPGNSVSASFTAIAPVIPPAPVGQTLTLVTAPTSVLFAGTTGASPFSVRLTLADGVTPVAGVAVTFAGGSNAAVFVLCGLPVCISQTDATGLVSTAVTGVSAGNVTLTASAPSPGGGLSAPSVSAPVQVVADQFSLVAVTPAAFLAEGVALDLPVTLQAMENGSPAAAIPVNWTSAGNLSPALPTTSTAADGTASDTMRAGPLAAGEQASLTACAWSTVCTTWLVTGVANTSQQIAIRSGGWQIVAQASGMAPAAIVALVTDGSGHPVAGATVTAYQQVTAYDAACPAQGRCPAAPVLASASTPLVSDADGVVTLLPLTTGQIPTRTVIALAAGTRGFCTTTLTLVP